MRLYDITTGTEDFIANGVVSHNCYARPSHAYMDLSPGIDFETKIFYKQDAARLLEQELGARGYVPKPITIGANTDPYQPVERDLRVTRSLLEVLERTRHPVSVITKGTMILRDLDLLRSLARDQLVNVFVSITSLDAELKRTLEPRAASPAARLRVVKELVAAGVPTACWWHRSFRRSTIARSRTSSPRSPPTAPSRPATYCCACRTNSRPCSANGWTSICRTGPIT